MQAKRKTGSLNPIFQSKMVLVFSIACLLSPLAAMAGFNTKTVRYRNSILTNKGEGASPGALVTLTAGNLSLSTTADREGKWRFESVVTGLNACEATISSGNSSVTKKLRGGSCSVASPSMPAPSAPAPTAPAPSSPSGGSTQTFINPAIEAGGKAFRIHAYNWYTVSFPSTQLEMFDAASFCTSKLGPNATVSNYTVSDTVERSYTFAYPSPSTYSSKQFPAIACSANASACIEVNGFCACDQSLPTAVDGTLESFYFFTQITCNR